MYSGDCRNCLSKFRESECQALNECETRYTSLIPFWPLLSLYFWLFASPVSRTQRSGLILMNVLSVIHKKVCYVPEVTLEVTYLGRNRVGGWSLNSQNS